MDYLDQQILMKLKENARQSASDISKEIHLSGNIDIVYIIIIFFGVFDKRG